MKKVLCLLMAICIAGGMLAACGNNQNDNVNGGQTENENGKPVVENNTPSETYLVDKVVNMTSLRKVLLLPLIMDMKRSICVSMMQTETCSRFPSLDTMKKAMAQENITMSRTMYGLSPMMPKVTW